jgi:flavorubredoxin
VCSSDLLDPKSQFDFHRLSVRKKKRFSPWLRKETEENISIIKQVYGYTDAKAREVLNILSSKDIEKLKQSLYKGGTKN